MTIDQLTTNYNEAAEKVQKIKVRMYSVQKVALTVSVYRARITNKNPFLRPYKAAVAAKVGAWKELRAAEYAAHLAEIDVQPLTAEEWLTEDEIERIDANNWLTRFDEVENFTVEAE